ncbi:hypothetical protein SKAU_G00144690 [Synaphobranchus kaupii]|uniref:FBX41/ZN365 C2H2-type zinc finger domain-containing protein n=1 Tax=Synaphobranchus kaupii TaxID=118154 RepID=A0A9Q1FT47_SYNKA|nr:hypothetical protein SKAU_G00144690 [Synaphobranchus kaupii]
MHKESSERKALLCADSGRPCGVALLQLAFHCPRCGEYQRFQCLSSLRPHQDYGLGPVSKCDDEDALLNRKKPVDEHCEDSPVNKQGQVDSARRRGGFKFKARTCPSHPRGPARRRTGAAGYDGCAVEPVGCGMARVVPAELYVRQRLGSTLRKVDSPVERTLRKVSAELVQKEAELLHEHAHSRHLALAKQEVLERERFLCRQVDVAVMVIGFLREHLRDSEQELERKEQEVITIHNFLEEATRQEMCGKVRIQHFIEALLRRIALAEMLLEYYQSGSNRSNCRNRTIGETHFGNVGTVNFIEKPPFLADSEPTFYIDYYTDLKMEIAEGLRADKSVFAGLPLLRMYLLLRER